MRPVLSPHALLLSALFATVVLLLSATAGLAQEEELPVNIKADFFRYDRRTRVLTATGNVVLTAADVVIRADALVANLETGAVTAEGNVRLEVGGQSVTSELLTYNLNSRLGALINARTEYTGPLVLGSVKLQAQRMEGIPDRFVSIKEGFVTTCDEQDPVVHITADEISVFLNDKIVGRRVSLWVGGRRLFTVPSFIIFLRERRETRITPVVGYSEAEGWFLKTSYSYFLNEDHYGFLHGDWMERLGVGTGIEHIYRIGGGQGSALVYGLANRRTGGVDLRGILNHVQDFAGNLIGRLYSDYQSLTATGAPPVSNLFTALDLSWRTLRSSTFAFSTWSQSSIGPSSLLTSRLAHTQIFSPRLSGEVVTDFSRNSGIAGVDDELFPRLALRYVGGGFTAAVVAETRLDLDGERFPGDARYTLERLPELTLSIFPFRLGGTSLIGQVEGGFGRFRETTVAPVAQIVGAGRADLLATVTGPVRLGPGTLGLRAFARGTWYTTGSTRLFYGGRLDYSVPLADAVEARVGYTGQTAAGLSPFVFDQITGTISIADAQLFYRTPQLFVRALGSYDFQIRQFGNVVAQAFYLPRPGWNIGAAASYNVNLGRLDRVEATLDLRLSDE